jgi:hypothetical protein
MRYGNPPLLWGGGGRPRREAGFFEPFFPTAFEVIVKEGLVFKKNNFLSLVILVGMTALFIFTGCDNPANENNQHIRIEKEGNGVSGGENEYQFPNGNIPAEIYPADLSKFIDGGVGWISAAADGAIDLPGYSVVVTYQDPAVVVRNSTSPPGSQALWNYKERVIAVYRYDETGKTLETLGVLDQVSGNKAQTGYNQLVVRMLEWDVNYVFYVTNDPATGTMTGTTTPDEIRDRYEKALVVYPNYVIENNSLTFVDGWLTPVLTGKKLSRKTLLPGMADKAFVNSLGTNQSYNFLTSVSIFGITSGYYRQSNSTNIPDGSWWTVNNRVYLESDTGALEEVGTFNAPSSEGESALIKGGIGSFTEVMPGGGGFANKIWVRPLAAGTEYVGFSGSRVKTSANLGGSPTDAITTETLWYGSNDLNWIYRPSVNAIVLSNAVNYNRTTNRIVSNTQTFVPIEPVAGNAAAATLKGIWAVRNAGAGPGYFYFDSDENPVSAYSSNGDGILYAVIAGESETASYKEGELYRVPLAVSPDTVPVPVYAGTYRYNKSPADNLIFSDGYPTSSAYLDNISGNLKKLSPGAATGLWIERNPSGVRYASFKTGGLVTYGSTSSVSAFLATPSGVDWPWYTSGTDIFVKNPDPATSVLYSLGVYASDYQITSTSWDVPLGGQSIYKVDPAADTPIKGKVWAENTPTSFAAIYEDPWETGVYGYSLNGNNAVKGKLYQRADTPRELYLFDDTGDTLGRIRAVHVGTYNTSGYMNRGQLTFSGGAFSGTNLIDLVKGTAALVGNDGVYLARAYADTKFTVLKPGGEMIIDTLAGSGGAITGNYYFTDAALKANDGICVIAGETGAFTWLGTIAFLAGGKITGVDPVANSIAGGYSLKALKASEFITSFGTDKWADVASGFKWVYPVSEGALRFAAGVGAAELSYAALYDEDITGATKNFYSYDTETGNAEYLGTYNAGGTDVITFGGSGGRLSALGTVRKLGVGAQDIKGEWASSKPTQESTLLTITDDTISVEKGVYNVNGFPANKVERIVDNALLFSAGTGQYDLYGMMNGSADLVYLGKSGLKTAANGTDPLTAGSKSAVIGPFSGTGTLLAGLGFDAVNDFVLPQDIIGSWIKDGGSAGRDDILIGDASLTIGSNGNSDTGTFVRGASQLSGTLYATLVNAAATPNYQWKFYVYNERNGLVYIGQGAFTRNGATAGPVNTLTFGTQTTVVKGGSAFKK